MYNNRIVLFRLKTRCHLCVIILGKCLRNKMEIFFFFFGIYFHSFNCTFVTVCLSVMVETDLFLIPMEGHTWNNILRNCDQKAVVKMYRRVTLNSFPNVHLPVFLTGFTLQCATPFEDFQKYHSEFATSRLALLLWCGVANIVLGVYFKRSLRLWL